MLRQGYSFIVCPDSELLRRRVDMLAAKGGMGSAELKVFWGDDVEDLSQNFWEALTQKSLFSTPKKLLLRRAHSLKSEIWDHLEKALSAVNKDVWVFICLEGAWNKDKASIQDELTKRTIWKHAEKSGWIWQSKGLDYNTLRSFVCDWVSAEKIQVEPQVLETLCNSLPLNAAALTLELDKLLLSSDLERHLLIEHISLVQQNSDMDIFTLMDAIVKGKSLALVWQRILDNYGESDNLLFPLISALCREARTLWALLARDKDIKIHPYIRQLKTPLAKRLGASRLKLLLDLLLEAELGVKNGSCKTEQALELLVANLTITLGVEQS